MLTPTHLPCLVRHPHGAHLHLDDAPFLMLGGELHNSSASALAYLEPLLDKLAAMHLNTVIAPISWELIEPAEDYYDFSLVDGLVTAACERRMRLVPLWFGTMKNAMSCYVPTWVKQDAKRFPRARKRDGSLSFTLSLFGSEAAACDARAFAATMRHLREIDGEARTAPIVQVQNEAGILGTPRDFSPAAEAAFAAKVPGELMAWIDAHKAGLIPEFAQLWAAGGFRHAGTWTEVFGDAADEVFMGWHVARFVEQVAAAGRAEYDLPMFANAWLIQGPGYLPGDYPSGGPVSKLLDVWRAAAPHIDLLAPDIYHPDFRHHCASYARYGNPLFIPETRNTAVAAANALYAFGRHAAICFAPFAIEDIATDHPLVETYRLLADLAPLLLPAQAEGRITGFVQQADQEKWDATLGGFTFHARTNRPLADLAVPGGALLIHLGDSEYLVAGRNLTFTFDAAPAVPGSLAELLWLDAGDVRHGKWVPGRRLNGDETAHGTGVLLRDELTTCRFRLHSFC